MATNTDPLNAYSTTGATQNLTSQASPPPAQGAAPSNGLVASAMGGNNPGATTAPAPTPSPSTYTPVTRDVDQSKETVGGQVDSVLAKDGPLFERARALALEQMQGRGLINSSMAVGAAQSAVIDKALQIATPDAATNSQAASENMSAKNAAGQFNANTTNQFNLQDKQNQFTGSEATKDREQQTNLTQIQQAGEDKRLAQQHANTLAQMGFQNQLNTENVPSNFAASVSSSTMDRVNSIMGDPNLDAAAKKSAIQNVVDYANSTMAWAEAFYKTTLPRLNVPGAAPAPAAAPAAAAPAPAVKKNPLPVNRLWNTGWGGA